MKILIKPSYFTGDTYWHSKRDSVVLVEKEADIEPLWKLLCEQDNYWIHYKNIIKVAPKEIVGVRDLAILCENCGKTDIDNIEELRAKIPFILYQNIERGDLC